MIKPLNKHSKKHANKIIMFNDNLIFLNPVHIPSRASYPNRLYFEEATPFSYHNCFHSDSDEEEDHDFHQQCYLEAIRGDAECRQRRENAIYQQAYMEAMERKRRQELIEKERRRQQYRMEVERIRQRQEEEEQRKELERQFMALFGHKHQEKLKAERMKKQRAKAFEELRRQEMMRRRVSAHDPFRNDHLSTSNHPMKDEQLIQGLDGNLYRVTSCSKKSDMLNSIPIRQCAEQRRRSQQYSEKDNVGLFQNSYFNAFGEAENTKSSEQTSKNATRCKRKAALLKSSILVGEVEDASDSECEEEYNDYWHNRRPQPGEWIEPIENMKTTV